MPHPNMFQTPPPEAYLLKWRGDTLTVTLALETPCAGRAVFRTNLAGAAVRRGEIIDETERGITPLEKAWADFPMREERPGFFRVDIPLSETGVFSGKACFFPEGGKAPEWPEGGNLHVKVESAGTRRCNSIYTVFPRQFGSFREVVRRLPHIMDVMGFRIVQTLPPFPVPTTYAVMGEYGCPFASTDFYSVDPAMAEFDRCTTPLDQFRELIGAVHARDGLFFIDLPANHTGWASTLQTHHPEWFRRESDGAFRSPGAWGVTWADLVELDYSRSELRSYMADVFLFWCRLGVDGFRCDAGYMIPAATWEYIVAKVRDEYPDTVFMLEGLGGEISVTDELLSRAGLDWAYSEIFQTYDRGQFEWYLPQAIARAEKYGTLVHFAETHDNDRLAKGGETYARLRVQLAALLSWQGAWGISNGVEWLCTEKIDVHGRNDLNWGASRNIVDLIARLNLILRTHPGFDGSAHLDVVTRGEGNTLAVARTSHDGAQLLVLANLDCGADAAIEWDRSKFPHLEAFDLLSERAVDLSGSVRLGPGEVMCLGVKVSSSREEGSCDAPVVAGAVFSFEFPRDLTRDVVVPEGETAEFSCDAPFRLRLVCPETGKTVFVERSSPGMRRLRMQVPAYSGDGTKCRGFRLEVSRYVDGRAVRAVSRLFVPPPARRAKMKTFLSGEESRLNPSYRAVLFDASGAAAQVRAGWGEIRSQYDAFLAANPDPACPSDRISLWARTRCWVQREGFVREFDSRCQTRFSVDPGGTFAKWSFAVACGMGQEASFDFVLTLPRGANAAVLRVTRTACGARNAPGGVRVVFRPDIEWRSFHSVTKAYRDDAENLFPRSVTPVSRAGACGFNFAPFGGDAFTFRVENGEYHNEPLWTYNVAHPEEADRGQEPCGDLFSPGWVSADLDVGDSVVISGSLPHGASAGYSASAAGEEACAAARELRASVSLGEALRRALSLYIVKRDDLKTVIAGYPWFLDWGRDTFIFMRGMIAAGMLDDSLRILRAFAAFEENGTLPNIIHGKSAGNRDTTDAPLWFVRCVMELSEKAGTAQFRKAVSALVPVCESIVDGYIAGTPNGIRVDADSALVWSPAHFTWMDTNYPACTPRCGYPVEIQALWISALRFLGRDEMADKAVESLKRLFKMERGYCDCLDAPAGEPAASASRDEAVRPNQLFLISLGVLDDPSILDATGELLVPGGVRSLASGHGLYRGTYAGDEDTSRKPAYHNGTVWAWPFPMYAEALAAAGRCRRDVALALLAGAVENMNADCLCHLSEIADGDSPHVHKGCRAQAWSDSELLRVWLVLGGK